MIARKWPEWRCLLVSDFRPFMAKRESAKSAPNPPSATPRSGLFSKWAPEKSGA
jgi:hypothetical protein